MAKLISSRDIGPGVASLIKLGTGFASPKKFGADSRLEGALAAAAPSIQRGLQTGSLVTAREAQAERLDAGTQAIGVRQKPVNFNQLIGGLDPQGRVADELKGQLTGLNVPIDDQGNINLEDIRKVSSKIDYGKLDDALDITIKNNSQNIAVTKNTMEKEIDKINDSMGFLPGSKDFFTANDFKTNPELARSFPVAAKAVAQFDAIGVRTNTLNQVQQQIRARIQPEEEKRATSPSIEFARQREKGTPAGEEFASDMLIFKRAEPFSTAFDKSAGREGGKQKLALEDSIVNAAASNRTIDQGMALLDAKQGIFSGPIANLKTNFNKYLKEVGVDIAGEQISNTETFAAVMARDVLNILGSGDLGAGTGISDNDRLFASQIVGGAVTLDEQTLRNLLDLNKRVNNAKITIASRRLGLLRQQREAGDPFAGTQEIGATGRPVLPSQTTDRSANGGGLTAEEFEAQLRGNR